MVKVTQQAPGQGYQELIGEYLSEKFHERAQKMGYEAEPLQSGFSDTKKAGEEGGPMTEQGCRALCKEKGKPFGEWLSAPLTSIGKSNIVFEQCYAQKEESA